MRLNFGNRNIISYFCAVVNKKSLIFSKNANFFVLYKKISSEKLIFLKNDERAPLFFTKNPSEVFAALGYNFYLTTTQSVIP